MLELQEVTQTKEDRKRTPESTGLIDVRNESLSIIVHVNDPPIDGLVHMNN